jgi:hypothetical protein
MRVCLQPSTTHLAQADDNLIAQARVAHVETLRASLEERRETEEAQSVADSLLKKRMNRPFFSLVLSPD